MVVSDGFRANLISRGVSPGKVHTIRNGVTPGRFDPDGAPSPAIRARLGARPGDCLVLYLGTHGISQALPAVADAAAQLDGEPIHFAFVGEGADKPRLRARVAELGLANVCLLYTSFRGSRGDRRCRLRMPRGVAAGCVPGRRRRCGRGRRTRLPALERDPGAGLPR